MSTEVRQKVRQDELPKLAGHLAFLKGMVDIERKVDGDKSFTNISRNMEEVINESSDIADRLLYSGLEEEK